MFKKKDPNLERLKDLLSRIEEAESPPGWKKVASPSVGGLTDLGFSMQGPYLLVISSQGRELFDCNTGESIARDKEEYGDWFDDRKLTCKGIGQIESELIHTCGIHGGGLPYLGNSGESIEVPLIGQSMISIFVRIINLPLSMAMPRIARKLSQST